MPVDEMFDIPPQDATWGHAMAHDADGLELHYVRQGIDHLPDDIADLTAFRLPPPDPTTPT